MTEGFLEGGLQLAVGFTVNKGSENGSQKGCSEGAFQKVLKTPPRRYDPLRVRPTLALQVRGSKKGLAGAGWRLTGRKMPQNLFPSLVDLFLTNFCEDLWLSLDLHSDRSIFSTFVGGCKNTALAEKIKRNN